MAIARLLGNEFAQVEDELGKDPQRPARSTLLYAQIAFARSILSLDTEDAEEALKRCWDADKQVNDMASGSGVLGSLLGMTGGQCAPDHNEELDRILIRADAHLMGAMMQLILGRYLRAGWNFRAGWNLYHKAASGVESQPDGVSDSVRCIIDFGIGMFNLIVSMLPSTLLTIAELAGYDGNIDHAKFRLKRSYEMNQAATFFQRLRPDYKQEWSPFSCLLLLFYYTQLVPNIGLDVSQNKSEVEEIVACDVARKHEQSALFQWMKGNSEMLHERNPSVGISTLTKARDNAHELPALQTYISYDIAWAHMEAFEWQSAAESLDVLIEANKDAPLWNSLYSYQAGVALLLSDSEEKAGGVLEGVAKHLDNAAGKEKLQVWGPERYAFEMAARLLKHSTREEATAAFLELLVVYDRMRYLTDKLLQQALEMTTTGEDKQAWEYARSLFILGAIHMSAGRAAQSEEAFKELLAMEDVSNDENISIAHYKAFALYLRARQLKKDDKRAEASELLKIAGTFSTAHMSQILVFKIHATW